MSFHMHLRAVVEGEVRAEAAWLERCMGDAWEVIGVEYAAGVAVAIEKDFGKLHELYEATTLVDPEAGPEWELPVYGGRVVYRTDADRPPFAVLGALIKAHIRAQHDGLRAFYGRAAAAGHEVVKAYWY